MQAVSLNCQVVQRNKCISGSGWAQGPGRYRRRNGDGCNTVASEFNHFSYLSTRYGNMRWQPEVVSKRNPSAITHPNYVYKLSSAWFEHSSLEKPKKYALPYIETCGRISNSTLYYWTCKPSTCVASIVATVHKKLLQLMIRRWKKKAFKLSHLLLRCATYYVFTKNDYFLNRLLALLRFKRSGRKRSKDLVLFYESKLDENTRFVIRQVWINQADWLKSRAERPRAQSKSIVLDENLFLDSSSADDIGNHLYARMQCNILRRIARSATTFWMLPYRLSDGEDTLL